MNVHTVIAMKQIECTHCDRSFIRAAFKTLQN